MFTICIKNDKFENGLINFNQNDQQFYLVVECLKMLILLQKFRVCFCKKMSISNECEDHLNLLSKVSCRLTYEREYDVDTCGLIIALQLRPIR